LQRDLPGITELITGANEIVDVNQRALTDLVGCFVDAQGVA
jgi:hypothetical protein